MDKKNLKNNTIGTFKASIGFIPRGALFLYKFLLEPKSINEDLRRREFILNIILGSSVLFIGFLDFTILYDTVLNPNYNGVSFGFFTLVFLAFLSVYLLSRFGFFIVASYLFIGIYFVVTSYSAYRWGSYLPSTLLNYVLLIIISSILISTRFGFVVTSLVSIALAVIGRNEIAQGLDMSNFWKDKAYRLNDIAEFIITFFIIMTVSWLSNREIEKSLKRARRSEKALQQERDNLEITVEQRTQKLKELQTERVTELHRLAESGKQAAGFFHDLMNPLTAIAMSVQDLQNKAPDMAEGVKSSLDQALTASRRMENFIDAIRKQSKSEEVISLFSLNQEIEQALLLLQHKAKRANISLEFKQLSKISGQGKPMQFYQIISNLVSNAIESYNDLETSQRTVMVSLEFINDKVLLEVTDHGKGIPKEMTDKIFNHFFTTKNQEGMGLGLAITKNIIEKELQGTIQVNSANGTTTFTVEFPARESYFLDASQAS